MDSIEERVIKLELCYETLTKEIGKISTIVDNNTIKLTAILSNTESLDKIIKYVVTPLIAILGAVVGIKVVLPS